MDKEVLEIALKRSIKDSNIVRILEFYTENALPKGENYTSNILRIRLKVVLGNGRVAKRSLIMKKAVTGETGERLKKDFDIYKSEAMVYSVILKEMEFLMEEFDDHDGPLWCNFICYDQNESVLFFEDLKASGFRLVPRQIGMDVEHALLTLRNLGRYHAMTKTLEERGIISKDDYVPHVFMNDPLYIKMYLYSGTRNTAEGIRKYWGPKWASLADKLSVSPELFIEKTLKSAKSEGEIFTCLNHGDCWSNNMMFKYDWQNRPVAVRLVDYQGPNHNSPCVDVTNFIYMSIQPQIRRENYKLLLECYHESLTRTLERYDFKGVKPSLEDIEKTMEHLTFFGLSYFAGFYALVICHSTDAIDNDKIFQTEGAEGLNNEVFNEDGLIEKLVPDLEDFAKLLSVS